MSDRHDSDDIVVNVTHPAPEPPAIPVVTVYCSKCGRNVTRCECTGWGQCQQLIDIHYIQQGTHR